MKLSVIVPVYNAEKYLAACVDSLLAQTLGDLEILLVDDGSKDASGAIADSYAARFPEKVRCLHIDNGGQGRARNLAMPLAAGEFVGFIDSDDWIMPDMYEKLIRKAEQAGADIAVCDWLKVFPDGREQREPARYQQHWLSAAGSACNKVFRRSLIGDTRFPEGTWYEDFYFSAMLMIKAGGAVYVEEPLYCYRQSPASTMRNNNSARNLEILRVMDMLEGPMRERGLGEDFELLVINHVLLDAIKRVSVMNTPDRAATINALRAYVRKKIPDLSRCAPYHRETRNRRLVMRLNYLGLHDLGRLLLSVKSRISR